MKRSGEDTLKLSSVDFAGALAYCVQHFFV